MPSTTATAHSVTVPEQLVSTFGQTVGFSGHTVICGQSAAHCVVAADVHDVKTAGQAVTVRGQIVCASMQPVGQDVFSTGQDVVDSGQTVCREHCVMTGDMPHCVATAGHAVSTCGHTVAVPVPSGQMVATVSAVHAVGNNGHWLATRGHFVLSVGQTVGVLVPSAQTVLALASQAVTFPEQCVGSRLHSVTAAGHFVRYWDPSGHSVSVPGIGHSVSSTGQTVLFDGHSVSLSGQKVATLVQAVTIANCGAHSVGWLGQAVVAAIEQAVSRLPHAVASEPSGHDVTVPATHAVTVRDGHFVTSLGQMV